MYDFNSILNWKLFSGSHDFPGPDGGTCINEAAIIAAGFKYKKVEYIQDLPDCFSKILGGVLIIINDNCCYENRQKLMKYVTRLAGSADTPEVEKERDNFIFYNTAKLFFDNDDTERGWIYEMAVKLKYPSSGILFELSMKNNFIDVNFDKLIEIIDGAFAIGNQTKEIDVCVVKERMEKVKELL